MPRAPSLDEVLPEFYLLSFLERKYNRVDHLGEKTVISVLPGQSSPILKINAESPISLGRPGSSVGNGSMATTSIALNSRAAKQKHDNILRLRKVESKPEMSTLADKVIKNLRTARRKLYSRGHCVPSPFGPGPQHPPGAAPIVLRAQDMGSTGRNATTSRPLTASERFSTPKHIAQKTKYRGPTFIRPTQRVVLNSRGSAIAEDCSRSSWAFKRPLDAIIMPRPSTFASSLHDAPLPDCAECLLDDSRYATLAGLARNRILSKTTNEDRLYLVASRGGQKPYPEGHPSDAPYSIDFNSPGSPGRRSRPCWKKSPFDS